MTESSILYRPHKYLSLQIIMNGIVTQLKQLFNSEYRNLSRFIYWGISHVFLRMMEVFMGKDTSGVCLYWSMCMIFNQRLNSYKGQFLLKYIHVCSWGSRGMSSEMVCHSLLQWTTFCQNSPPRAVHIGWPCMVWLIAPFSYTRLWSRGSFWLAFCDGGFHSGGCGIILVSSVCPLMDKYKRLV